MKDLLMISRKVLSKLLVFLLIFDLFAFADISLNGPAFAAPVINEVNINTTDNEVSVSGTGDGNGVDLADKPFRYSIGSSQSEWVRDSNNITINEILTTGALSNTQVVNNLLSLAPASVSGSGIEVPPGSGLEGYAYEKVITIDHTKVDSELTNFPATVYLDSTNFDFSKCKPDGSDIRFTDKSLNPLKFEREQHTLGFLNDISACVDGTAFADSFISGNPADNAFNGSSWVALNYSTYIGSNYIGYSFTSAKVIRKMTLKTYQNTYDNMPSVIVQGSNDGTTWTNIATVDLPISASTIYSFNFDNNTAYVSYRLLSNAVILERWVVVSLSMFEFINPKAVYNVLVPKVSNQTDTEFCMLYGNPNAHNTSFEAWQDQTGKQITYNGNVKLAPNVAKFGQAAYFDGSGDYISIPYSADFDFGTGDFTLEGNYIFNSLPVSGNCEMLFSRWTNNPSVRTFYAGLYNNGGIYKLNLACYYNGSSRFDFQIDWTPNLGKMYNIEIDRSGNNFYFFIDGVQIGTTQVSDADINVVPNTIPLFLGTYTGSNAFFNGYMDEIRISNIARHTSNFTPSTEPYIEDANTKLFLHFNSSPFTDETGKTINIYGDIKPVKTAYADGARSAYFDGSGDYFNLDGQSDFAFGTGDFCIEFIAVRNSTSDMVLYDCRPSGTSTGVTVAINASAYLHVSVNSGLVVSAGASNLPPVGQPFYVAVSKESNVYKIFVDGILCGTANNSTSISNYTGRPFIGGHSFAPSSNAWNGYILGARITKGRGRYTENYAPPTQFNIDGADVVFCTNFDTIYDANYAMVQHMGASLVDATGNGNNGTATGTTLTNSNYGKVRVFDGIDDYINIPHTASLNIYPMTITTFLKVTEPTDNPIITKYTSRNGYILSYTYLSGLGRYFFTNGSLSNYVLNYDNEYGGGFNDAYEVAGLRVDQNGGALFKGATKVGEDAWSGTPAAPTTAQPLYIGRGQVNDYLGMICAEVRLASASRSDAWIKAESLSLKNELLSFVNYAPTGTRESEAYDISGILSSSKVEWTENKPIGTNIIVESNVSLNGGSSWLGWKSCTNGAVIADLGGITDTSNARLKLRQTLSTSLGAITPRLSNSIITIGLNKYIYRVEAEPNNEYTVRFDVKDVNEDVTSEIRTAYTKTQTPQFTVSDATINSMDLLFSDENPQDTEYQIMCDSRYINSSGVLTSVPAWITLDNQRITVLGLNVGTMYNFLAKARNQIGEETDFGSPVYTGTQGIPAPTGSAIITGSALNNSITISWNEMEDALSYELEMDGIIKNVGNVTYYIHKDLMTGTLHTYRVRGKNLGGYSEWSEMISINTTSNLPLVPTSVLAKASDDTVTVYWNPAQDALAYIVELDGMQVAEVSKNSAGFFGLQPETVHTYRVKSCNLVGESEWSDTGNITTYYLDTPEITIKESDSNKIKIGWEKIKGAVSYRIALDADDNFDVLSGPKLEDFASSPAIVYIHENLPIKTAHVYKVRAESPDGDSAWSDSVTLETLPQRPAVPENFRGNASNNFITLIWDAVQDAIGYDLEVDGIVIENDNTPQYQYKGLDQYTEHTYRVRSVTNEVQSYWSNMLKISTLGGIPDVPGNVVITNSRGIATLDWDKTPGAQSYDVEVDDTIYSISDDIFVYRSVELIASSAAIYKETAYRIRAENDLGQSDWTDYYVNNAIMGQIEKGKELELGLTASNITDFSRYTLYVNYNDTALTVIDLCAYSAEKELAPGMVEGRDIEIVGFEPGHIVFRVNKIVDEGYLWTGIINNIKFVGNASGGSTLTYTAQCLKY